MDFFIVAMQRLHSQDNRQCSTILLCVRLWLNIGCKEYTSNYRDTCCLSSSFPVLSRQENWLEAIKVGPHWNNFKFSFAEKQFGKNSTPTIVCIELSLLYTIDLYWECTLLWSCITPITPLHVMMSSGEFVQCMLGDRTPPESPQCVQMISVCHCASIMRSTL